MYSKIWSEYEIFKGREHSPFTKFSCLPAIFSLSIFFTFECVQNAPCDTIFVFITLELSGYAHKCNRVCSGFRVNYVLLNFSHIKITKRKKNGDIESSFSNHSITSPTSQLILQPFFRFSYVTGSSLTSLGEPPMNRR